MEPRSGHLFADARLHALGAVVLAPWIAATSAFAQASVEVSPLRVELKTAPGGTTTQAIMISNTGESAVRVRATLSDWYLSPDGAPQFADASDGRHSATAWTRLAPPEQVIEAGRDATVRFTLSVPAGAGAAGYRTGILFEFAPPAVRPRSAAATSLSAAGLRR
jgi:P pilus assembly chaperone PapD